MTLVFDEYNSSESGAIRFSDNLDGNAIQALAQCGLQDRFPVEYNAWVERQKQAVINSEAEVKRKEAAIKKKLDSESHQLEGLLREAIVDVLITLFPCVTFFMSTTTGTHVNFQEL